MPEQSEISHGEVKNFSFFDDHNPVDEDKYFKQKLADVISGKATWAVRNFDADHGRVYDRYINGVSVGFVDHDFTVGYTAYRLGTETDGRPVAVYIGTSAADAARSIEDLAR